MSTGRQLYTETIAQYYNNIIGKRSRQYIIIGRHCFKNSNNLIMILNNLISLVQYWSKN